jgi:dUTP pyrophosphatase
MDTSEAPNPDTQDSEPQESSQNSLGETNKSDVGGSSDKTEGLSEKANSSEDGKKRKSEGSIRNKEKKKRPQYIHDVDAIQARRSTLRTSTLTPKEYPKEDEFKTKNKKSKQKVTVKTEADAVEIGYCATMDSAVRPEWATSGSAAADLYSPIKGEIPPMSCLLINLGFVLEIPQGYAGKIESRSGLAVKSSTNTVDTVLVKVDLDDDGDILRQTEIPTGLIDSDYRGNIHVFLRNFSKDKPFVFEAGTRIAQMMIVKTPKGTFVDKTLDEMSKTVRGNGAFGHTGITVIARKEETIREPSASIDNHQLKTLG